MKEETKVKEEPKVETKAETKVETKEESKDKVSSTPVVPVKVVEEKQYSIDEILKDTKIQYIRNLNAPKGCFIQVVRSNEDNRVLEFVTYFPSGRTSTSRADSRNATLNSTSNAWVAFDIEKWKAENKKK